MKTLPIAVVVLMASAVGACATQRTPIAGQPAPSDADSRDAAWAALDTDHDRFLTLDELNAQRATALRQDFKNADLDHDGRISWSEWNQWWPRINHTPPSASLAALNATDTLHSEPSK